MTSLTQRSVPSIFLFLWLMQMFCLVAFDVVIGLEAGILGGRVGDIVAGIAVGGIVGWHSI